MLVASDRPTTSLEYIRPLNGKPRDYQIEDAEILSKWGRGIAGHEMGLGKSLIALMAIRTNTRRPVLVICPKFAIGVWSDQIDRWLGEPSFEYVGTPKKRAQVWEEFREKQAGFVITNYALAPELLRRARNWPGVILDEAHKLRNRKTKTFMALKSLHAKYLYLLTGSPVVSGVPDLWSLLHLLDPHRFSSYWSFVDRYSRVVHTEYGTHVYGVKDPKGLQNQLKSYMVRRRKSELGDLLPPKIRTEVPLDLLPTQREMYDQLAEEMLLELGSAEDPKLLLVPTKVALITRLRQLCITPELIGGPNSSAALEALQESAEVEFESGNSIVVFTPFAKVLPYIEQLLEETRGLCDVTFTVKGGMSSRALTTAIEAFQNVKTHRKALLVTIQTGASWTATAASTAFFVGYEWNPSDNWQAEDRLHRLGQQKTVNIKYFVHRNTIDRHVMKVLDRKTTWANTALNPRGLLLPGR